MKNRRQEIKVYLEYLFTSYEDLGDNLDNLIARLKCAQEAYKEYDTIHMESNGEDGYEFCGYRMETDKEFKQRIKRDPVDQRLKAKLESN